MLWGMLWAFWWVWALVFHDSRPSPATPSRPALRLSHVKPLLHTCRTLSTLAFRRRHSPARALKPLMPGVVRYIPRKGRHLALAFLRT